MRFTTSVVCGLLSLVVCLAGCNEPRHLGRTLSSWTVDLKAEDAYKRRSACEALGNMGDAAKAAVPDLIELLDDANEGIQGFAVDALVKIGEGSVAALEPLLNRPEPHLRLHAATAMVKITPDHPAGQKAMMTIFTGLGNADLAKRAQEVIVRVGQPFAARLMESLTDRYEPVRMISVQTLGKMHERAADALPALIKIIQTPGDWKFRKAAMESAANIGGRDQLEEIFRGLLDNEQEEIAMTAGHLLKHIGVRAGVTGMEGHVEPTANADGASD